MEKTTNSQLFAYYNIDSGNVTNSHNTTITNNKTITVSRADDEDGKIKQWLSPLDPRHRHQSVQTSRADGVGGWLLERDEFREWSGSYGVQKQAVLFCHGDPGVGKTHITLVTNLPIK